MFRTVGQDPAVAAAARWLRTRRPHAVVLTGPPGVGKGTLATDAAAAILCLEADQAARPCWACRACRLVAAGGHPDVHRLRAEGAGGLIGVDRIRELAMELALLPAEGRARVAIVEDASRLSEDAQNALLKTLEEPPSETAIILCADDEDRLLETVRSRCGTIRLGLVGPRAIEGLLGDRGLADPAVAGRLARVAGGRPGLAVAYARAPEAVVARGEAARILIDLLAVGPSERLPAIRTALATADRAVRALAAADPEGSERVSARPARGRRPGPTPGSSVEADGATPAETDPPSGGGRASASDRRRAAAWLLEVWRELTRDLIAVRLDDVGAVRDVGLLDELTAVGPALDGDALGRFLARSARSELALDVNASPELVLDVLVLAWPRARRAA